MLAKVIKQQTATAFVPFSIPEIGEPKAASNGAFVFPNISELSTMPVVHKETPLTAPTVEDVLQNAREEAAQIVAQAHQQSDAIAQLAREKAMQEARQTFES